MSEELIEIRKSIKSIVGWMEKLTTYSLEQMKLNPIPPTKDLVVNELSDAVHIMNINLKKKEEKLQCFNDLFKNFSSFRVARDIILHAFELLTDYIYNSDTILFEKEEDLYRPAEDSLFMFLNKTLDEDFIANLFPDSETEICYFNYIKEDSFFYEYFFEPGAMIIGSHALFLRVRGIDEMICVFRGPGSTEFDRFELDFVEGLCEQIRILKKNLELIQNEMRLSHELEVAALVQQELFPKSVPKISNIDIAAFYKSATETGGDWHGFLQVENLLYVLIGDVTGHGVPAALVTATVCGASQMFTDQLMKNISLTPNEILDYLNRVVCYSGNHQFAMTFFVACIDLNTGEMDFSNAGHNFPIILSEDGSINSLLDRNTPLGYQDNPVFYSKKGFLKKGDLLVFYTDGLIENPFPNGEDLGEKNLKRMIKQYQDEHEGVSASGILNTINVKTGECKMEDDVTLICMHIKDNWPGVAKS
ncbi:MAG: serine/threonine-protein phosphatase [SAR324 cluster bacterium]|nr:serine/threonine-protein phosphatase [SAR324 cluster bacterium]